jgi:hypothetical protein
MRSRKLRHFVSAVRGMDTTVVTTASSTRRNRRIGTSPFEDLLRHEIEAVIARLSYGMGSGWSNRKNAMSDRIQFEK